MPKHNRQVVKNGSRIVIADDEPIILMDLHELLCAHGYDVVGRARDGFDAVKQCRELKPDLLLLDIKMPLLDGLSVARIVSEENCAGCILLLSAYNDVEFVAKAKQLGIDGYLVKPISEKNLIPALEVAMARSREISLLKQEVDRVNKRLENRRLVEQAKGLLMEHQGYSEHAAYEFIRMLSKEKLISMKEVSELIIERYSL